MLSDSMLILGFVFLGLIIGSFSNMLIYRLPHRISLLNPKRSCCPNCKQEIKWVDNIPILSWLMLRGKCRACQNKISIFYPLVELANAIAAYYCAIHFSDLPPDLYIPTALLAYLLCSILITISIIDIQHMIIPDRINKPGMVFGVIVGTANQFFHLTDFPFSQSLVESLIGLTIGYGILYIIAKSWLKLTGVSGMGFGDVKLMGFMGALLGPVAVLSILISSSFIGVIFGLIAIVGKRYSLRSEIPFGPSLAVGIALYIFGFDTVVFINNITTKLLVPTLHG